MIVSGSLVVCVDDDFPVEVWNWAREIPRRGNVYTVKRTDIGRNPETGISGPGLVLFELYNPINNGTGELQFAIWRFREYFVDLDEEENEFEEWLVEGIGQLVSGFCE